MLLHLHVNLNLLMRVLLSRYSRCTQGEKLFFFCFVKKFITHKDIVQKIVLSLNEIHTICQNSVG